jgi:hypothetical protein
MGLWMAAALGLGLGACSHHQAKLDPPAAQAVNAARGICPTDLNQSEVIVEKRSDGYALVFRTEDDSQRFALYDRVKKLGGKLSVTHVAVDKDGELIQHAPAGVPELLEAPSYPSPGYAVELRFHAPEGDRDALHSELQDHLRMWHNGECPEMRDQTLRAQVKGPHQDR